MHTGDLAVMDDDGYVDIMGRFKDLVIRGGENVYPREVEEFLYTHPDIVDVAGRRRPRRPLRRGALRLGHQREGRRVTAEAVRAFCQGNLAHYKVPRNVTFVEEFPMTVTGKVRKFEMREKSVEILDLGEAAAIRNA